MLTYGIQANGMEVIWVVGVFKRRANVHSRRYICVRCLAIISVDESRGQRELFAIGSHGGVYVATARICAIGELAQALVVLLVCEDIQ